MDIILKKAKENEIYDLGDLAGEEVLEKSLKPDTTTVVAYGQENGQSFHAGMLQYSHEEGMTVLNWLYVAPAFRWHGIGAKLVEYLLGSSLSYEGACISTRLYEFSMADLYPDEMAAFLEHFGFERAVIDHDVYCIKGKDLFVRNLRLSSKMQEELERSVISFGDCTPDILMNAASSLKLDDVGRILSADRKHSFLLGKGSSVRGMLRCTNSGGTVYLKEIMTTDKNPESMEKLVMAFFTSFRGNMRLIDRIIVCEDILKGDVIFRIFPGFTRIESILMTKRN